VLSIVANPFKVGFFATASRQVAILALTLSPTFLWSPSALIFLTEDDLK